MFDIWQTSGWPKKSISPGKSCRPKVAQPDLSTGIGSDDPKTHVKEMDRFGPDVQKC
jgi:hypothetical protein